MAENETVTDIFISNLLDDAGIEYTPQGSTIQEIKDALATAAKSGKGNRGRPEFVAKSGEFIIIIEDKANVDKQRLLCERNDYRLDLRTNAVKDYAENGAVFYANHIVQNTHFRKVFAFGCSGDEKHHIIRPIFVNPYKYEFLDEVENFKNFNKENIKNYYKEYVLKETPPEQLAMEALVEKSKELNKMLTFYGQVGDKEKPLVVSAILLALNEHLNISSLNGDNIKKDGDKIYDSLCCNLERVEVGEKKDAIMHQFNFIKDRTTLNEYHEKLGKTPLKYFTEYINDEIFPSISTTHDDILGYFYGEFIKYSGGDGQSLGIVLTPKHITELFCELLNIKPTDKVLDPCTGTASFLVSAMNKMIGDVKTEEEKSDIKQNKIHGIEIREEMFTIASTNMILRGDGKSNLILGDFLKIEAEELQKQNFTVGVMNPPYSQGSADAPNLYEINFIKHLLDSLGENGRCAVIVPQPTMMGNTKETKLIKKQILKEHTLEGVITLNGDTSFYGVGVNPCIAVFKAHQPHPAEKRCKFINFVDDGYRVRKHIGIVDTPRAIERRDHLLKCWRDEKDADSKFMVKAKVKYDDEWLHSYYYFDDEIPSDNEFLDTIGKHLSFEFSMVMDDNISLFNEDELNG